MAFINQGRNIGTVGLQDAETLGGEEVFRTDSGVDYKIHTFTTSGTFEVTGSKAVTMDFLSIAGGGAAAGGGGGAGGMVVEQVALEAGIYDVIVGAGGSVSPSPATRGADTTFRLQSDQNTNVGVTDAIGGGTTGAPGPNGAGSGGSGSGNGSPGTPSQGNNGGSFGGACAGTNARATGGGGGAGSAGTTAGGIGGCGPCGGCRGGGPGGTGGSGLANNYRTGSDVFYAGGGQGSGINLSPRAPDGSSVPGHGGGGSGEGNTNGVANKGGGGGARGIPGLPGEGIGGSGIVVVRAPFPARNGI